MIMSVINAGVCADGRYLPSGGTSADQCEPCPVGTYRAAPDTVCQECDDGFTTRAENSTGVPPTECVRKLFQGCLNLNGFVRIVELQLY